ncbi:MAG: phosphotransferase [Eubacteriaceae bacterium]|nr:phosphotransferase [Eubacteriaceae bacterium]
MPELIQLSENITYLVLRNTGESDYVLRLCRPGYHTLEELESELIWIDEVRSETNLVAAEPFYGTNNERIQHVDTQDGIFKALLFEFLPGSPPGSESVQETIREFELLGIVAAQLHKQSKNRNIRKPLARFTWDFDTTIGGSPIWGKWQDANGITSSQEELLAIAVSIIKSRLEKYGKTKENYGLIHADLRFANLIVERGIIKVIDFDDSGYSWYMYDFAASISFIEHLPEAPQYIEAFKKGYRTEHELKAEDEDMVETFIMLRRLQLLAWLTSHSDSGPVEELANGFLEGTVELAKGFIKSQKP